MSDIGTFLFDAFTYLGDEAVKGVIKAGASDLYSTVKRRIWGQEELPSKTSTKLPDIPNAELIDRMMKYLGHHDRAIEATLQCLEQLADRLDKQVPARFESPILLAVGLTPLHERTTGAADTHVKQILNDRSPGTPQSIKAGYALLHLRNGNRNLAEIFARSTISVNPADARAHFVLGLLPLQNPIRRLSPVQAKQSDEFLRTASEAGLSPQCAVPRAALRYDHYKFRQKPVPEPSIENLSRIYVNSKAEATSWPYGELNNRLNMSPEFKKLWWGR
jgi:hypothetical protein